MLNGKKKKKILSILCTDNKAIRGGAGLGGTESGGTRERDEESEREELDE